MSYLILGLVLLAFAHFIFESIIAPSLRMQLRHELFYLRDGLRALKIEYGEQLDDKHFNYLQDSINSIISTVPRIDIAMVRYVVHEVEKDPELKKRLAERQRILDDCDIPELMAIRKKSIHLSLAALGVNSGMWAVYILPAAAIGTIYKSVKRKVNAFISLPEPDLERIVPSIHSNGIFAS